MSFTNNEYTITKVVKTPIGYYVNDTFMIPLNTKGWWTPQIEILLNGEQNV